MHEPGRCPKCGAFLAANARHGFCLACLFDQAALDSSRPDDSGSVDEKELAEIPPAAAGLGQAALPRRFGDYEILEQIGEGGMGVVYKARQRSLDRLVALKLLPLTGPHARPEFIKRFHAEAVVAASLQHPNIVTIHEVGLHEGQHFFAMDYVAGRSLAEVVGNCPLPPKQAARYLQGTAEAVHYAHERGILHRDLKPSNILIDAQDLPRVADFGLARRLDSDSELTLTGQVLGSPHYIPPEQAAGKRQGLSRRSDVYGLGAILYHLLTGRPPFVGEEMAETLQLVLNTDPVSPRLLNPLVPRDLETICLKCLEKEPAQRYATAQAVAEELAHFLRGEPIAARPVGVVGRLCRWCRRKPALAGAVGGLVLSVVLGLVGVLWQWSQTRLHAAAEHQERLRAEERLTQLELNQADVLFGERRHTAAALAWLAHVARNDPSNLVAPQRLVFALTYRNFALPLAEFTHVSGAAWHPGGERIALGSTDGTARVWTAAGGEPLTPPLRHTARVNHLHFAPDGNRLVTASEDGTARVWDATVGQSLLPPLEHGSAVVWAEFSPDGRRIATVSQETDRDRSPVAAGTNRAGTAAGDRPRSGVARLWDAATGAPLTPWLKHPSLIFTARFSPDGRILLTASWKESIRLWNVETGQAWEVFPEFRGDVRAVAFSPDTRWVLASDDKTVHVWDVGTGQLVASTPPHSDIAMSAQFTPDGSRIFTSYLDGCLHLFEAGTGRDLTWWRFLLGAEKVRRLRDTPAGRLREPFGHDLHWERCVEFSPDGQKVVSAAEEGLVKLWSVPARQPLSEWLIHEREVARTAFSPDGRRLLTCSSDGAARVWDVREGGGLPVALRVERALDRAQFSPDGRRVLTADASGSVQVWDSLTGQRLPLEVRHSDAVRWAEFSPKGEWIATGSRDHTARVWDALSGQSLTAPLEHQDSVNCVRFSPKGPWLVTASDDGTARVWDLRTGQAQTPPLPHDQAVCWTAFSPDGQRVVTASWDGAARVWDARSGQRALPPLLHQGSVLFTEFTRDGTRLLTASQDGTVRFWDARTGQPLPPVLRHPGWVLLVRLNSQETLAATACSDKTARVWDLATGRVLFSTDRHAGPIQDVQFTPDGAWLASTSGEGHTRIWDWSTGAHLSEGLASLSHCLEFSPDGQRLLTGSHAGAQIWELPRVPGPAPAWLPRLAEAVGGRRLSARRQLEPVPLRELLEIRRAIEQSTSADPYTRWAKWFLADRSTRPQSPGSVNTVADHIQGLLDRSTEPGLRQALRYSPTNREAFARLAKVLRAQNTKGNAVIAAEADWCERMAKKPAPR